MVAVAMVYIHLTRVDGDKSTDIADGAFESFIPVIIRHITPFPLSSILIFAYCGVEVKGNLGVGHLAIELHRC